MLNVSDKYKRAIKEPSRLLKSTITINNKIYTDSEIISINYDENLFMESEFSIGSAIMSAIEIELKNTQEIIDDFKEGSEFEAKIGIEISDNNFELVSLGFFTVEDIEKNTFSIKIYANDRMIRFEKDYITDLNFPVTLKDITLDIGNKAGVELKTSTFINSDYVISIKPDLTDITLRKALMYIAELAGGYARISRDGYLEIFNIDVNVSNNFNYASESLYSNEIINDELSYIDYNTVTGDNFITFSNKVFTISTIDKVVVEISGIKEELGEGENTYYIVDNLFCQNPAAVIKNIYDVLSKISYIPFDIKLQGDPAIQSGDSITIKNNGTIINTLVTSRNLSYQGGLTEQYKAVGKSNTEKQSTGKGSVSVEVDKVKTEIKVVAGEVEQKVSNEDFESYVKQTAEEIATKVTGKDVETLVKQNAESWELSINGKLKGKSYKFDGENFTIGDSEAGSKAEHNNLQSKWFHEDGSYTIAGINGLQRYESGVGKTYFYKQELIHADISSGQTVRINAPVDFIGKGWKSTYTVRGVHKSGDSSLHAIGQFWLNRANVTSEGYDLTPLIEWLTINDGQIGYKQGGVIQVVIQFIC